MSFRAVILCLIVSLFILGYISFINNNYGKNYYKDFQNFEDYGIREQHDINVARQLEINSMQSFEDSGYSAIRHSDDFASGIGISANGNITIGGFSASGSPSIGGF